MRILDDKGRAVRRTAGFAPQGVVADESTKDAESTVRVLPADDSVEDGAQVWRKDRWSRRLRPGAA